MCNSTCGKGSVVGSYHWLKYFLSLLVVIFRNTNCKNMFCVRWFSLLVRMCSVIIGKNMSRLSWLQLLVRICSQLVVINDEKMFCLSWLS